MSYTQPQSAAGHPEPAPHPLTTLLVTVALLATVVAVLVAVSYPVAALTTAALGVATASAVRYVRRSRLRRATARRVCIPHTDVCVTV